MLERTPLYSLGPFRWAELVLSLYWLHERTGEAWLLELARKALAGLRLGAPTTATTGYHQHHAAARDLWHGPHVVNTGMALKAGRSLAARARRDADRAFAARCS